LARFLRIFVSAKSAGHDVGKENNRNANVAELLVKAQKPNEDAMRLHALYRGRLEVTPKCAIRSCDDFWVWYTQGVTRMSLTKKELIDEATKIISRAQRETKALMEHGVIAAAE
jgi:malic enzyme